MKLGFFKPKLELPAENIDQNNASSLQTASFSVRDINGNTIHTADLKGKIVFINFWATWCPPCIAEMPSIETLYQRFKGNDQVVFLIVEIESNLEKATKFMSSRSLTMPLYFPESQIPAYFLGGSIPTTVILDKSGNIAFKHEGIADYSSPEVAKYISELINKK